MFPKGRKTELMPVTVIATLHAHDGKQNEVLQAISEAAAEIHSEPGCLKYAPHRSGRGRVVIVESWQDKEALDAHAKGPRFAALSERFGALLSQPPEILLATPEPVGDATRGAL